MYKVPPSSPSSSRILQFRSSANSSDSMQHAAVRLSLSRRRARGRDDSECLHVERVGLVQDRRRGIGGVNVGVGPGFALALGTWMGRKCSSSFATTTTGVAGVLVCVGSEHVTFPGHAGLLELSGVLYKPRGYDDRAAALPEPEPESEPREGRYSAVVMMHGCSGMWSERVVGATHSDGSPNLQNNIKKWGIKLAESNVVALAVDSFTPRMPEEVSSSEDWQNQCSDNGGRYAGAVSPYTDRVLDARAAWEFLNTAPEIDSTKIGLLGWSHGAQAVMVEVAESERHRDVPRADSDHKFVCSVAFYPGCGKNLGFGATVATSFWRPLRPMQLHMGERDPFYWNSLARKNRVGKNVPLQFSNYRGARHHFDALSQAWPPSSPSSPKVTLPLPNEGGDDNNNDNGLSDDHRAMCAADVAALEFLLSELA